MDTHSDNHGDGGKVGRWVFWGYALVAAYFLYTEHRAHLFAVLPYLLLAACPLMHLFHHHGGHGHRHADAADEQGRGPETEGRDSAGATPAPVHGNVRFSTDHISIAAVAVAAFPGIDFLSHDAGHLLETMFGWRMNPYCGPFHLASNILIIAGFFLLSASWRVLYEARRKRALAGGGPYARIRHPQYAAFVIIMFGFLLQWPTLITLVMFPILVLVYARLARTEEQWALKEFGEEYRRYRARTPAFIPRFGQGAVAKVK